MDFTETRVVKMGSAFYMAELRTSDTEPGKQGLSLGFYSEGFLLLAKEQLPRAEANQRIGDLRFIR